jgi:hypothetical protein
LAVISLGRRINKQIIFSLSAGGHHKMIHIQGWHSMYYNDIEKANDVTSWCNVGTEERSDEGISSTSDIMDDDSDDLSVVDSANHDSHADERLSSSNFYFYF